MDNEREFKDDFEDDEFEDDLDIINYINEPYIESEGEVVPEMTEEEKKEMLEKSLAFLDE